MKLSDDITTLKGIGPKKAESFRARGIDTVEDLINHTEEEMMKVRNLGKKSLEEVILKLESLGLALKKEED